MPDPNSKPPKKIRLPMLPMRDIVVFPHMTAPFFIGRPLSIAALEEALSKDRKIFVVAQEDPLVEEPEEKNLFRMGTVGRVLQIMRLHNGTIKALFEAQSRARLENVRQINSRQEQQQEEQAARAAAAASVAHDEEIVPSGAASWGIKRPRTNDEGPMTWGGVDI